MTVSLTQAPTGYVLWEGPSPIDGSPIVAIATLHSSNTKTGNMVQTWILRQDLHPVQAVKTGEDESICGGCPHRGNGMNGKGRTCYVNVGQGPRAVWAAYTAGKYPQIPASDIPSIGYERAVRLGAYGDPAMIPVGIWRSLISLSKGHTGYTHQWNTSIGQNLKDICMASVDTEAQAMQARDNGWRTFRVRSSIGSVLSKEVVCPASEEGGHKTTCENCLLCRGADPRRPNMVQGIVIVDHGPLSVQAINRRTEALAAARARKAAQSV